MRKAICMVLCVLLIFGIICNASALTINEFVERYNKSCGESYKLTPDWFPPEENDKIWFLSAYSYSGDSISVLFVRNEKADPMQYQIDTVFVRHKPRTSVGRFVSMADLCMAAVFPEMDPTERARIILDCMMHSEILFGEAPESPIANNVAGIGQFVYQETVEFDTLLIPVL